LEPFLLELLPYGEYELLYALYFLLVFIVVAFFSCSLLVASYYEQGEMGSRVPAPVAPVSHKGF